MGMLIALSAIAASASFRASPYNRKLAAPSRRNGFVNLRATHSPPVAPHPVSHRRSANPARATVDDAVTLGFTWYGSMRRDSHPADKTSSRTHDCFAALAMTVELMQQLLGIA